MSLRIHQSPQDWRKTHVAFSHRPRRCHQRHIHGPLLGPDEEDEWPLWTRLVVGSLGLVAVAMTVTVTGGM